MSSERVRVKVCGLTVPLEAARCAEAGAWAVGVVFAPESVRRVDIPTATAVLAAIPADIARVGVFVDAGIEEIVAAARACGLTHIQLHGDSDIPAVRAATGLAVILGIPFDGPGSAARADASDADMVLFDAAVPGRHGGTGMRLDWDALAEVRPHRHFGLAGGLSPSNVGAAVRRLDPWFVDVSTGVESAPGRKDPDLVRQFMEAVSG